MTALERAQATAYPVGEYVGQESFMRAAEIRRLAHQARVGPAVSVLDLCCGVAGPVRGTTGGAGGRHVGIEDPDRGPAARRQLAGRRPPRVRPGTTPPL